MAKLLQTLVSFIALFLMLVSKVHSDDVTSFTIDNFNVKPLYLTYAGDAYVPSGTQVLRLTRTDTNGNALGNSIGRVFYNEPVQFWESQPSLRQSSFETTIKFVITPPADNSPAADGIVFFIAPLDFAIPVGSFGGNFGIFDPSTGNRSHFFAIEFDTYVNGEWDPEFRHIGIDIESRNSVNTTRFDEDMLGQEVTLLIEYEENTRKITASATVGTERVEVEYFYDLKTILNEQVHVGISASTGGYAALHDVTHWYFTSTLLSDNQVREQ